MGINNLLWVPIALLLGYMIPACYYDVKYRELPKGFWTLLWTVCVPLTALLYLSVVYPIEALVISLFFVSVYFILMSKHIFEGADFMYLAGISLFFVTNPINNHSLMCITYAIFLIVSVIGFAAYYQVAVRFKIQDILNWTSSDKLEGFPMILPISLALILTVVLG